MQNLTQATELDAVNTMLSVIGEAPLSTLTDTGLLNAEMAQQILREASRSLQDSGWHFNTDEKMTLTPDSSNEIVLGNNVLRVVTSGKDQSKDVAQRGTKLYNRENHSYTFTDTLEADVVFFLDWPELPETARKLITIRAARQFQARVVGSEILNGFTSQDEQMAMADFRRSELRGQKFNMVRDSYSSWKVLGRR